MGGVKVAQMGFPFRGRGVGWRALLAALLLVLAGQLAAADSADLVDFSIGAQSLAGALDACARQARIKILFTSEITQGLASPAVEGRFTVEEGMQRLLADSGLHVIKKRATYVILRAEAAPESAGISRAHNTVLEEVVTVSNLTNAGFHGLIPTTVLNRSDVQESGHAALAESIALLPEMQGSEVRPNVFIQNFSTGTAPVSLRGLGLGATLVLINGQRATRSGAFSSNGSTFVDLSIVPPNLIERVEVVKDGGSALFGSDAVAGVVNVITRREFDGVELAGFGAQTTQGPQRDAAVGVLWGRQGNSVDVVAGLNYLDRQPLATSERSFATGTGYSAAGQPGNFLIPGRTDEGLIPDPACIAGNGIKPAPAAPCMFDYISRNELVVPETHFQGMAAITMELESGISAATDLLVARNRVDQQLIPPSLPAAGGIIPADHPEFPFSAEEAPEAEVVYIGRPVASNFPAGKRDTTNNTLRWTAELNGPLGTDWSWELGYQYSRNDYSYTFPDTRRLRFQAALQGQGGPTNDEWINVFGRAEGNTDSVLADVLADHARKAESDQHSLDFMVQGELGELPGGGMELALGWHIRRESLDVSYDRDSLDFNLSYIKGGVDYSASKYTYATLAELSLPVYDALDIQLAARYEYHDTFGGNLDPKVALRWQASPELALRSSFSTTFRTPSLHQTAGFQSAVSEYVVEDGSRFAVDLTVGNPQLNNESARTANMGLVWTPGSKVLLSVDYWRIDYRDVVTKQDGKSIFDHWVQAGRPVADVVEAEDAAALVADWVESGRPADALTIFAENGVFAGVFTEFVNAAQINTSGIDIKASMGWSALDAYFSIGANLTYTLSYDLVDESGMKIDGLGSRNFSNFANANQQWRGSARLGWEQGVQAAGIVLRYTGAYDNDERETNAIGSHTEVDLRYGVMLDDWDMSVTFGVLNVFDRAPPRVDTNFGYDSQVHDPRQRVAYLALQKRL